MVPEEVQPICSPEYAVSERRAPAGPGRRLGRSDPARREEAPTSVGQRGATGSTSSDTRTRRHGYEDFDNYTLTLQAAVAGRGVALGWRYCIEWYLDSRRPGHYRRRLLRKFPDGCFASLTDRGRRNPGARKCLAFFENFPEPRMSRGKFDSRDRSRHVKLPSWPSQETVKHRSRS